MGTCRQCGSWSWARPHLCKLARHEPWPVRKRFIGDHIWRGRYKTGRIGNNSVVEHRSRRPVLSPLRNCVDIICHVWPYWASRCKPWRWMLKDISIHRPIWTGFGDLKLRCHWLPMTLEFVAFCPTQRWTRVESVRGLGWVQQRCAGLGVTTARDEDYRLTVWITYFVWLCYPASELPCYKKLIDWLIGTSVPQFLC